METFPNETEVPTMRSLLWLILCAVPTAGLWADDLPKVEVTNVRRAFHNGEHNAFTDLAKFNGKYYLTFRTCPDGHMVHPTAGIIILTSDDLQSWREVHRFSVKHRDTRDPHFLVFQDKLFVYTGTWYSGPTTIPSSEYDLNKHLGYAAWTSDGRQWQSPVMLEGTFGHYIWRASAYQGKAYLCGRRKASFAEGPKGEGNEVESVMLESDDGLIYRKKAIFQETAGDETAFLFEEDGSLLAIGRRGRANAQLITGRPPYQALERVDLDRYIGGPLVTKWQGRLVVGGRHTTSSGPKMSMCWLNGGQLTEFAELPSAGDNSYPGFLQLAPDRAVMSYYSTHEKSENGQPITAIYLADLKIRSTKP